ncbi:MAG TPA: S41 family peptidase, partial [Ramlibacter sp.]|uniref:S41 family peptidase n=1 Tax=Ramlibacter sp. TaxID=1917967 RepID=UPI002ED2E3DF
LLRCAAALSAAAVLLAGCGGGGGGDGGGGGGGGVAPEFIQPTTPLGSSRQYSQAVAGCSLDTQKKFVRSYLDEVYLWYNEIVDVDPNAYNNVPDYFNALLVRTPDVNGQPKDRFSAVIPAAQARNLAQQYAVHQAAEALTKDGPGTVLKSHTNTVPVTNVVASTNGRQVGYILFNSHDLGAQDDLIAAFQQLQAAGVQDLILDLRNNSGGFLYIALTAASMIAGLSSEGQVFERLQYNDKRAALTASSALRFSSRVQFAEPDSPVGTPLPQLALPRVFILTSGNTCSASESIINSLRGIGVQVVRIGDTTCGKPYGFTERDNCGLAFFPIEFKGSNAQGFGDYTTGFQPTCRIADTGATPGSATDPLYNGALFYIDNNACPAGTFSGVQSAASPLLSGTVGTRPNRPSWAGRVLLSTQQSER